MGEKSVAENERERGESPQSLSLLHSLPQLVTWLESGYFCCANFDLLARPRIPALPRLSPRSREGSEPGQGDLISFFQSLRH